MHLIIDGVTQTILVTILLLFCSRIADFVLVSQSLFSFSITWYFLPKKKNCFHVRKRSVSTEKNDLIYLHLIYFLSIYLIYLSEHFLKSKWDHGQTDRQPLFFLHFHNAQKQKCTEPLWTETVMRTVTLQKHLNISHHPLDKKSIV